MQKRAGSAVRRLLHGGRPGEAGSAQAGRIASNISVQVVMRVVAMPISLVTVSLTARTLNPVGFGVWTAVGAYVGIVGTLTSLGVTTVAMQRMASEPQREAEWLGAMTALNVMASLLAVVACLASVPFFLGSAHDQRLVGIVYALTILSSAPNALTTVFQSRLRSGLALSFSVIQSFGWMGLVIAFSIAGASVVTFAIGYDAVIVVISALQIVSTRRFATIDWRGGRSLWWPLARVAIPIGIANVLIIVYYQVDAVLLLKLAGPREAGVYGAAYRFLTPLQFLPAAVMSTFFPVFSALRDRDPPRMRRLIQRCAELMAIISLPALAVTVVLSGSIIHRLYGGGYGRAAGVLPILMIAFVSICYGNLAGFLAPLLQLNWRLAAFSGLGAVANVVLNLILIPAHGAYGSAWATVITEVLTMSCMLGTSLTALRLPLAIWPLARVVVVAGAMTGLMALAAPLGLIPAAMLGGLVYIGGLFALRVVDLETLRSFRTPGEQYAG